MPLIDYGFEGWILVLVASVPGLCILFTSVDNILFTQNKTKTFMCVNDICHISVLSLPLLQYL